MRKILLLILLAFANIASAQQLFYSRGRIFNSNDQELSKKEMRQLLADKPGLLNYYNSAITKQNVGGFLLGFGGGLMIGDLVVGLTADVKYPGVMTYIGAATALVSIPIISGYSKKLRTVVEDYNKQVAGNDNRKGIDELAVIANQNGVGVKIKF